MNASPTPMPGRPVRGSTTGRSLMAALDLFGRRWTLRIIWELGSEPLGFRLLQRRCDGMSSSVLQQRLTELQETRLAEVLPDGNYALTTLGREARESLDPVIEWSRRWAAELAEVPPTAAEDADGGQHDRLCLRSWSSTLACGRYWAPARPRCSRRRRR
jgi:DNA-binding HxlR family transcriptional regulator